MPGVGKIAAHIVHPCVGVWLRIVRVVGGLDDYRRTLPFLAVGRGRDLWEAAGVSPAFPRPGLVPFARCGRRAVVQQLGLVPRLAAVQTYIYSPDLTPATGHGVALQGDRRALF